MPENKSYGRTKSGVEITDELIEQYVAEAEEGLDLDKLRPRGRPRMGAAPAKSFPVRLDPDLRAALDERAEHDGRPASEVVREALRRYLEAG
jgi:predicted DNA-binding protein